jgi:hypothetical protein
MDLDPVRAVAVGVAQPTGIAGEELGDAKFLGRQRDRQRKGEPCHTDGHSIAQPSCGGGNPMPDRR